MPCFPFNFLPYQTTLPCARLSQLLPSSAILLILSRMIDRLAWLA
jgi:hypothetical protein